MRSNQTRLVSQPPTNHSLFEILGFVLRAAHLSKNIFFRWKKNFHIPPEVF